MDEVMYSRFFQHFVKNAGFKNNDVFIFSEGTYLHIARNKIHNAFLESGKDFLMMLDSDVMFPPNIAQTLWTRHLPIVGGWYHDKKGGHPAVYDLEDTMVAHRTEAGTGIEKVYAMGAGCWLMSKETAKALGESPYEMHKNGGGEDFVICEKMLAKNIPLHVDWEICCAHLGVFHV
jgi:choline kinase